MEHRLKIKEEDGTVHLLATELDPVQCITVCGKVITAISISQRDTIAVNCTSCALDGCFYE